MSGTAIAWALCLLPAAIACPPAIRLKRLWLHALAKERWVHVNIQKICFYDLITIIKLNQCRIKSASWRQQGPWARTHALQRSS